MTQTQKAPDYRRGYDAGWAGKPLPAHASAAFINGYHVAAFRAARIDDVILSGHAAGLARRKAHTDAFFGRGEAVVHG